MSSLFTHLRRTVAFYKLLYRDAHTPIVAKVLPIFAILYFLSPFDIIPDFLPIIGQIDDLIVILAFIAAAIRLIPYDVRERNRIKVRRIEEQAIDVRSPEEPDNHSIP